MLNCGDTKAFQWCLLELRMTITAGAGAITI